MNPTLNAQRKGWKGKKPKHICPFQTFTEDEIQKFTAAPVKVLK